MTISRSGGSVGRRPRVELLPDAVGEGSGGEAVELAALAGLHLDGWQQHVLRNALGERADGSWAAFEVGVCVPRQNGKGAILEARELAGLFLLGERLIIHSAHQFDTSLEAFRRLLQLIEDTPDLDAEVAKVSNAHGEEGITLRSGSRIRFRTRTKGGGRGFSADCLILDEAMFLAESFHGALLPILSARPNPQVWYTGSAVDQYVHENGVVFSRVRKRGIDGDTAGLAYFEWSLDADNPGLVDYRTATTEEAWAAANPALNIRISPEHVAYEQQSLGHREFVVERLNVGDWPAADGMASVIDLARWDALEDAASVLPDPVALAFDMAPDRSMASIAAAGVRADGRAHVEIVEHRRGTSWLPGRVAELVAAHENVGVGCDATGPAASLLPELQALGVIPEAFTSQEHAQACGRFFDAVEQATVRHLGSGELRTAVRGADRRPLGDAWAWSRKNSSADISPLVAATLALSLATTREPVDAFVVAF